jgi:hypothetical protein
MKAVALEVVTVTPRWGWELPIVGGGLTSPAGSQSGKQGKQGHRSGGAWQSWQMPPSLNLVCACSAVCGVMNCPACSLATWSEGAPSC